MVDKRIKALKKDLAEAEKQSIEERRKAAREIQVKFKNKQLAEGKQRLALWVTTDEAALIRLIMALPDSDKRKLTAYLQRA